MRKFLKDICKYWLVWRSGLVDREYYRDSNPDIVQTWTGVIWHYLCQGWREGCNPNEYFDTKWYLRAYPDVARDSVNPLYHYLKYGWKANRDPSENFSTFLYLNENPDVRASGMNLLVHFLRYGRKEGRQAFSASSYHINESELLMMSEVIKNEDGNKMDRVYTLSNTLDDKTDSFRAIYSNEPQGKLIMTLWVRDEIDIIEYNINFHLKQGVDFIIASDNGSKDGTREVLEKYQQKGVLRLLDDPVQNHAQAACVNRMAHMALEQYGAKYIFHCDADEFWFPKSGSLKDEICTSDKEVLKVNVINVLLYDKGGEEAFPVDTRYAVVRPIIPLDYIKDSNRLNLFYFQYQPSVIFRGYHEVSAGNHTVTDIPESEIGCSENIIIYHYPLRNKKRFIQKVINKGKSYQASKVLTESQGFHNRRWYEAYKNGEIDHAYKELILSANEIENLKNKGLIKEFQFDQLFKEEQPCS